MANVQDLTNLAEGAAASSQEIVAQLLDAAASLERGEMAALDNLSSGLALLDADFRNLRAQVAAYANDRNEPEQAAEAEGAATLTQLRQILTGIEQNERDAAQVEFNAQRDDALRVLDQCRRLSHIEETAFPPLQ